MNAELETIQHHPHTEDQESPIHRMGANPRRAERGPLAVWDAEPGVAAARADEIAGAFAVDDTATPGGPLSDRDTILVPVDFSSASVAAARRAEHMASAKEAVVQLMHVFPLPPALAAQDSSSHVALLEVESDARSRLHAIAARLDVATRTDYHVGDPATLIARRARELNARRIVMGARRRRSRPRYGSVARQVHRAAPCPITLVDARS